MDLLSNKTSPPNQPLIKNNMALYAKENNSWDGQNTTKDFLFEEFSVGDQADLILDVFPDGNSTICFEFTPFGQIRACFFGKMTETKNVLYRKGFTYFAVKIPPTYLLPSTELPISYFVNRVVKLETFTESFKTFPWANFTTVTFEKRIELFQQHVKTHFAYYQNEFINYVLTESLVSINAPSIKDLAKNLGVTDRYIRKLFSEHIGLPPKKITQVIRLQHSISFLLDNTKDMSDAYLESDFYDHPHFNKFFKQQTTYSPSQFKKLVKQGV